MKVSLLCMSCLCYLVGLAVSSHFRGGIIQWRPVNPRPFDGEVSFCTITILEPLTLCWRYVVGWLLAIFILLRVVLTWGELKSQVTSLATSKVCTDRRLSVDRSFFWCIDTWILIIASAWSFLTKPFERQKSLDAEIIVCHSFVGAWTCFCDYSQLFTKKFQYEVR